MASSAIDHPFLGRNNNNNGDAPRGQGGADQGAFDSQTVPISGVIFDPVYDMEGRERNYAGKIYFAAKYV